MQQRQLWLHTQLAGDAPIYNEVIAIERSGTLIPAAVERTLAEIVRRHEAWRTTFILVGGRPMQVVQPPYHVHLPGVDLRGLAPDRREAECQRLMAEDSRRPFNLDAGPLWRAQLVRLEDEQWRLCLVLHHLLFDGITIDEVLLPEFIAIYEAYAAGKPSTLPEPPLQYADFAEWQQRTLTADRLRPHLEYWRAQLADPPPLDFPTDKRRPPVPRFRGAQERVELPPAVGQALVALGRRHGATSYMTLLTTLVVLLHRYQGHDDVVVGAVSSARKQTELESVLGYFVNTLALRTTVAGNPSFSDLLHRVRATVIDALSHDEVPFDLLVRELSGQREAQSHPFFQVMFTFDREPVLPSGWRAVKMHTAVAKFDLHVRFTETSCGLDGLLNFDTDLFTAQTARRMAGHLCTLLEAAVRDPGTRVSDLPLLTPAERQTLVVRWNETSHDYARDATVHELFERQVDRTPNAVALTFQGEEITYAELNVRADRVAVALRDKGVLPGALVGVCLPRSTDMVVALLGVLKAGAGYVPVEPSYPDERLAFVLHDAGVRLVITSSDLSARPARAGAEPLEIGSRTGRVPHARRTAGGPAHGTRVPPDAIAYVTYTSGSTGRPKGVPVPHRGVVRLVDRPNYVALTPDDVMLQFAPLPFDASTFEIWGALLNGARLAIFPPGTPSLQELGEFIARHGVTTLWLTAPLFHQMVEANIEALRGVRQLLAGGDVLSPEHVRSLLERRWGTVINGYGPTENTTFTCCHPMTDPAQVPADSVPIGRPIANTKVYVLDRYCQPVPVGVPGELYIGGDGLAAGYLNRPELTAERFVPDPFALHPGGRLYRSGDRVRYRDDGALEFLGRLDRQVKIRGFRIEPGEIEAALMAHRGVREVVVLGEEAPGGGKRLTAYVVTAPSPQPSAQELRDRLARRLPDYMIPSSFVMLDRLPLTATGKLDRAALQKAERPDTRGRRQRASPRTASERTLERLWREVLGVSRVGIDDNFFDIGGDSLQAVRLFAGMRERLGQSLPLATLFRAPTIRQLAVALEENDAAEDSPLVAIQPNGTRPPLFFVHPIGGEVLCYAELARLLGTDQPFYGLRAPSNEIERDQPTIQALASHYVDVVQCAQRQGPYRLGGWSLGGILAYEMARQLRARGEDIAALIVIDTVPDVALPSSMARRAGNVARRLPYWVLDHDALYSDPAENFRRIGRKARFWTWRLKRAITGGPRIAAHERTAKLMELWFPEERHRLVNALYAARRTYVPAPYDGPLLLFRSRALPLSCPEDPAITWARLVRGEVDVRVIPGSHKGLLKEPGVYALARQLREFLSSRSDVGLEGRLA